MRSDNRRGPTGFTIGYDLGIVGTWARVLMGVVASLALITTDVLSNRPTPSYWSQAVLWFLAILAVYTVGYVALAPRVLPRLNPWVTTVVFYGPALILPYLSAVPDTFRFALTLYIVISIAVVLSMGYGGNAVVGIPALLSGRRHVVYCPWNATDLVDKAIEDSRWSIDLRGGVVKVVAVVVVTGVLFAGFSTLGPTEPLTWVLAASASIATVAGWVLGRRLLINPTSVE